MAVSGILSLAFIGLAVVSAAVSLLVHAYRRFKEIQSPKRWIAFEVLMVLPVCLILVLVLPDADVLIRSYVFGLALQLPVYWVLAVLGVRLTIEVCLPFTRWLVASKKSISKST
ncbi:MAG: hypothetical protein ACK5XZ_14460 [Hyphomonadaceae bacterium]|uniref:hypothetical protein n=1 Tax=Aquidulcibacter sp. TaxID=2052990 RepID=UPI0022C28D69|nr:hypothetical protein [Aquidulcibacter sp.]MCE2889774.1 hypothetical protein [Hyphomonadaceae bacterium]MCZ8209504.1 hypothetical protein [Aquidulcibacter sp.]